MDLLRVCFLLGTNLTFKLCLNSKQGLVVSIPKCLCKKGWCGKIYQNTTCSEELGISIWEMWVANSPQSPPPCIYPAIFCLHCDKARLCNLKAKYALLKGFVFPSMGRVGEGAWRDLHLVNSQGCYFWASISYLGCRSWPPCPRPAGLHKQNSIAKKSKPDVPTANKSLPLWQTQNELTSCTSCLLGWPKLSVTTFPLEAMDETRDERDVSGISKTKAKDDRISFTISITWFPQVVRSPLVRSRPVCVCVWFIWSERTNTACRSLCVTQPHFCIRFSGSSPANKLSSKNIWVGVNFKANICDLCKQEIHRTSGLETFLAENWVLSVLGPWDPWKAPCAPHTQSNPCSSPQISDGES